MRMRYALYRMGADPDETEIDEGAALVEHWVEERGQMMCPLIGGV